MRMCLHFTGNRKLTILKRRLRKKTSTFKADGSSKRKQCWVSEEVHRDIFAKRISHTAKQLKDLHPQVPFTTINRWRWHYRKTGIFNGPQQEAHLSGDMHRDIYEMVKVGYKPRDIQTLFPDENPFTIKDLIKKYRNSDTFAPPKTRVRGQMQFNDWAKEITNAFAVGAPRPPRTDNGYAKIKSCKTTCLTI